ncbi:hypothetical protein D3C79_972120 [compost metagenome]
MPQGQISIKIHALILYQTFLLFLLMLAHGTLDEGDLSNLPPPERVRHPSVQRRYHSVLCLSYHQVLLEQPVLIQYQGPLLYGDHQYRYHHLHVLCH